MPTVRASGESDPTQGFKPELVELLPSATYFLAIDIDEPTLKFARRYGDFVQVLLGFPSPEEQAAIYFQPIWLDCIELNIRRDYIAPNITVPMFKWYASGLNWQLISVP